MLNIIINTDYLKSWNGIFKLLQLVLGAICIGIISNSFNTTSFSIRQKECFFLIATSSFFNITFIIFISYLVSPLTIAILPKTVHERFYNFFAVVIVFAASVSLIIEIHTIDKISNYEALLAASICGLLNSILYAFSGGIAHMTR
ncbi:PREDICTED: uncharacterized protein LOC105453427 [Wasmannia auropunctata]|uniref:uncharacterized protein LOC105453427 n=1 Tax=Wasmannia auropunctata TaxID=64793 RepID=UPI0005F0C488|nr:PREDICTED: uncharacterized protein LOC105453427 [Wasmannia auropunctata]XP_011693690.1 PREDICTED: uncharacterized protein LOC105453427 [Wasmannia auropunctata]XP_011693691.1 PREDICTED: uncharacterized protein LOC105453427 [Wasmannia auropunctata]